LIFFKKIEHNRKIIRDSRLLLKHLKSFIL